MTSRNIAIGNPASDFVLKSNKGADWRLADHFGSVAVLLFYPQNETMVCTRQLCAVRDNWQAYLETKAVIVGISEASPGEHAAFSSKFDLPIPLLADPGRVVTNTFAKHWIFPLNFTRAVVVIDAKGIIRNVDIMLRVFRPLDEQIITDIYAARGDALTERYDKLRGAASRTSIVR